MDMGLKANIVFAAISFGCFPVIGIALVIRHCSKRRKKNQNINLQRSIVLSNVIQPGQQQHLQNPYAQEQEQEQEQNNGLGTDEVNEFLPVYKATEIPPPVYIP